MAARKSYKLVIPAALEREEVIQTWAERYPAFDRLKDQWLREILQTAYSNRRCLALSDLICLGIWKNDNERGSSDFKNSTETRIRQYTGQALQQARIEPLLKLEGFQLPMASSLMHFVFPEKFPIIDKLALFTLLNQEQSIGKNLPLWRAYQSKCLEIKRAYDLPLRTIDRALWQYAKEYLWWRRYAAKIKPHPLLNEAL